MPEIKNTFLQGKMNKDLDERLIPNGQYTDAQNIEVNISEGSSVGTVQNIFGNEHIEDIIPEGFSCVGSVVDENENKLYWFVKGSSTDAIAVYDEESNTSSFVAVDNSQQNSQYSSFLNFTGKQITGINVIDNFLFWTDGVNEPKRINLDAIVPVSIEEHSFFYTTDSELIFMSEEHVTVVKKKPNNAPHFEINSSVDTTDAPIFNKTFARFAFRYKYEGGEYSAFGPFTNVVFNPQYGTNINEFNAYTIDEPYNKAMVNSIKSIDLYNFVPSDIPKDVVQVDILYKQENSPVVYSVASFTPDDDEWISDGYGPGESNSPHRGKVNISTENIRAALPSNQMLRPWDNVPRSAVSQEIVGNRLVYGNYKQNYNLDGSVRVSGDYVLRPNQDFSVGGLRSLKSLRDYRLGVVFGDKYGRETPVFTSDSGAFTIGWQSDEYGQNASRSTMIKAKLDTEIPDWAYYYKFYVKQTSSEYYNLIMDKAYVLESHSAFENKGDHAWIAFASADRNKIVEDDFIIIKKVISQIPQQIEYNNKYKILDISNEAPDAIKFNLASLGVVKNTGLALAGAGDSLFQDTDAYRIDNANTDILKIRKNVWTDLNDGIPLGTLTTSGELTDVKDIYVSWKKLNQFSERYEATDVSFEDPYYVIKLNKRISSTDAAIADVSGNDELLDANITLTIENRVAKPTEDFSGKFFVKVKRDASILLADSIAGDQVFVTDAQSSIWLNGVYNTNDNDYNELTGIINSTSIPTAPTNFPDNNVEGVTGLANTEQEWDAIIDDSNIGRTFFIDNMYFVASNPSSSNFARESGEGWRGARTQYGEFNWAFRPVLNQSISPSGNVSFTTLDSISEGLGGTPVSIGNGTIQGLYTWTFGDTVAAEQDFIGNYGAIPEENYYGTQGGYGLAPRPQLPTIYEDQTVGQQNIINGIEGVVTTTSPYTFGARRWMTNSIYDTNDLFGDLTYGNIGSEGNHFIHFSFLGPGEDLLDTFPDEDGLPGVTLTGFNGIGNKLQGIWGGGVFTNTPSTTSLGDGQLAPVVPFDNDNGVFVEFEGNYSETQLEGEGGLEQPPGPGTIGYDTNYQYRHDNQWDPSVGSETPGQIINFRDKLIDPTSSFRFSEDPSGTVYNIESVSIKKIYNHTSWRKRWLWNGNEYVSAPQNSDGSYTSVEQAAVAWANNYGTGTDAETTAANNLKKTLENFGKRNNRRVCYIVQVDKNPSNFYNPVQEGIDMLNPTDIEFVSSTPQAITSEMLTFPAVWETEPQNSPDLNLYYEASDNIPTKINYDNVGLLIPIHSRVEVVSTVDNVAPQQSISVVENNRVTEVYDGTTVLLNNGLPKFDLSGNEINYNDAVIKFTKPDGGYVQTRIVVDADNLQVEQDIGNVTYIRSIRIAEQLNQDTEFGLSWFNCFSFGDGVESNRIRDKFNEMQITSGAKVSTVLEEAYAEEVRKNGLIYSGIYNSNSGVNNLNQFIAAEKITKDLNPTYGSIQKLFTRNTDLIALCEDRVLKILANKDALFNADGNPQLVSNENVLGQAIPFVGDFGISKNPESFAFDSYRAYFSDKQRGAILRLSMDGLTPVSDAGMRDWFRDHLNSNVDVVGSFDDYSKQYNVTITPKIQPNLVENSTLQDGEITETLLTPVDIISNGSFNSGVDFDGSAQNLAQLAELSSFNDFNIYAETTSTLRYFPETIAGDIVPYQEAVEEVAASEIDYGEFVTNPRIMHTADFSSPTAFIPSFGSGDPGAVVRRTKRNVDTGGEQAIIINPTPEGESIATTNLHPNTLLFSGLQAHGRYSVRMMSSWGVPFFSSSDLENDSIVFPAIKEQYPSALNNTIFNGEEIKITFKAGQPNGQSYSTSTGDYTAFKIELFDGNQLISNENLHVPSGEIGSDDFNSVHDPIGAGGNYRLLGYRDENNLTFGHTDGAIDDQQSYSIYYKFTNGTTNSEIVVNKLTVKLTLKVSLNDQDEIYLSDFEASKVFQLMSPQVDFVPAQDEVLPEPAEDIPAFFEVTHHNPPGWYAANAVAGSIELLGPSNPAVEVTASNGETYFTPSSINEDIDYLTYYSSLSNVLNDDGLSVAYLQGEIPITGEQAYVVGQDGVFTYTMSEDPLAEDLIAGNVYIIDLELSLTDGITDILSFPQFILPFITGDGQVASQDDVLFGEVVSTDVDGSEVLRPQFTAITRTDYGQERVVLRTIFKPLNSINALNIDFYDPELNVGIGVPISGIRIIDITSQASGGTATDWDIPSEYLTLATSLDTPELYYKDGKINWNTSSDIAAGQAIDNPQSSPSGWKLKFTVGTNVDTNEISGTIGFSVSNGDGNGFLGGNFSESGVYEITGNFSNIEEPPFEILKDGEIYTSAFVSSITGSNPSTNLIRFFSNVDGFVGSIDDVSLIDLTEYQTTISSAEDWIIGPTFDQTLFDYITWDNGQFIFNQAGHFIYQNIGDIPFATEGIDLENVYQLSFDLGSGSSGNASIEPNFKFVYFNSQGYGFEFNVSGDGYHEIEIGSTDQYPIIYDVEQIGPYGLIIQADGEIGNKQFYTIDNIEFRKVLFNEESYTVSYSEDAKGWVSFKSFIPENANSLSNKYFTFDQGRLYQHNMLEDACGVFYDVPYSASVTTVINQSPSAIKHFNAINYEGSQAMVRQAASTTVLDDDGNVSLISNASTYNVNDVDGWSLSSLYTNEEQGYVYDFIEKEGKWFNYISGLNTTIDTSSFTFQGLGLIDEISN
jgi:hypothetical protein